MVVSHYLEKRFKRGTREVDFLGVMCFRLRIGFRQPWIRTPAEMHQRPPLHQPIERRNTDIKRLDALELLGVAEVLRAEYLLDIPFTGINEGSVDTEQRIDKHPVIGFRP